MHTGWVKEKKRAAVPKSYVTNKDYDLENTEYRDMGHGPKS
jgi:hypothetical protein